MPRHNRSTSPVATVLLAVLAIFVPPLPVLLKDGCSAQFIINLLLTFLAWFPGVIHAWWILFRTERVYSSEARSPNLVFVPPREKDAVTGAYVDPATAAAAPGAKVGDVEGGGNMQGYYGPGPQEGIERAPAYDDAVRGEEKGHAQNEAMSEKYEYRTVPVQ